ncbi:hypothetical protein AX16_007904 [Volvariella volvacea WC 439]|nr:hypothetical protein AX16_007904 [Volvariella volvacea WC 439]
MSAIPHFAPGAHHTAPSSVTSSVSTLRELTNILTKAVDDLESTCARNSTRIPDLHDSFTAESEAFRQDPQASETARIIYAAAMNIGAAIAPPQQAIYEVAARYLTSSALRLCLESGVTEILREAGPKGMHVREIGERNGQDPQILARFLRLLATQHVYREIEPDVFTNTRISSTLDTSKASKEVIADPNHKYDGSQGIAALVSHQLDESYKAATYGWEALENPSRYASDPAKYNPWSLSMRTDGTIWDWFNSPQGDMARRRFVVAMEGTQKLQPIEKLLSMFDWKNLAPNSLVVDVGGNVGAVSLILAAEYPHLQIVVQDLPSVIQGAKEIWDERLPGVVDSGRVTLEENGLRTRLLLRTNASVFFLKHIIHDWPDDKCRQILAPLRQAASPDTRLLLMECVISYTCRDTTEGSSISQLPGRKPREAPPPLLANHGQEFPYLIDTAVFHLLGAQERTVAQFDQLLFSAGWKLIEVYRLEGSLYQLLEAVPVLSEHAP